MNWLSQAGAIVAKPLFEAPDYDLIADFGDRIDRVQVKTSTCWAKNRFVVALCTRGGNQSWNGIVKRLNATRCDSVFVHVGDGRRWYIPATALGGGSCIVLGGPKYAEYEVESGAPLQARPPPPGASA
jgi:PD-(D/E)XK endonuclease